MSEFTLVPGTPAIAATPTKVSVTLTLHQALIIAVLDGDLHPATGLGFYHNLKEHPLYAEYRKRRQKIDIGAVRRRHYPDLTGEGE